MKTLKTLLKRSKGFTLIELMVVMTIMSVLAAIVVPQVTGTTTGGKGIAKTADIKAVQEAVDRFVADNPKGSSTGYPVDGGIALSATAGSKPIDWNASFRPAGTADTSKYFSIGTGTTKNTSDYLKNVKHATETRLGTTGTPGAILGDGDLFSPNALWNRVDPTTVPTIAVWRIDNTGTVTLSLADGEY